VRDAGMWFRIEGAGVAGLEPGELLERRVLMLHSFHRQVKVHDGDDDGGRFGW